MNQYKHLTPDMVAQVGAEVDRELEERHRSEQVQRWMVSPANQAQLAHIRAELDRVAPLRPAQRAIAQPTQPGKLPAVINMDQRFHPSHLKMKPATPRVDSIKDPYCRRPNSI